MNPGAVAAVIIEPVLGEGGFVPAPPDYLRELHRRAQAQGILLIADEIQTGFGRTGRMLAIEHSGVVPDMVVLAKSMAGGIPLSAVVGRPEVMDAPGTGGLGGTFAGNPLACAAANAVLGLFDNGDLLPRAGRVGSLLLTIDSAEVARALDILDNALSGVPAAATSGGT